MNRFLNYFIDPIHFYRAHPAKFKKECISGLTVAILVVPESVAFSIVANLPVIYGLRASFLMCFIGAALGGKPGSISAAAGAMAVVIKQMTDEGGPLSDIPLIERVDYVLLAVLICGVFQILAFGLTLSRFVTLIPHSAMIGFLNGLAITILMSQLTIFKRCPLGEFSDCTANQLVWLGLGEVQTWMVLYLVLSTTAIMYLIPKLPSCRGYQLGKILPPSLIALLFTSFTEHVINRPYIGLPTRLVIDVSPINGNMNFHWPSGVQASKLGVVFEHAVILAAIGLIESLMTLQVLNELTKTTVRSSDSRKECGAQGIGNLVCGLFGAMGGSILIGQSVINIMNGSENRLAGLVAGWVVFIFFKVAGTLIGQLPIAALVGVLFMVVGHTFHWQTFRILHKIRRSDALTIIVVTVLAATVDLAVAVVAGVVWNSLVSSWDNGKLITSNDEMQRDRQDQLFKIYHLNGALFFGSITNFNNFFNISQDPQHIALDFSHCWICDLSAASAIERVVARFQAAGKNVYLCDVNDKSRRRLQRLFGLDGKLQFCSLSQFNFCLSEFDLGITLGAAPEDVDPSTNPTNPLHTPSAGGVMPHTSSDSNLSILGEDAPLASSRPDPASEPNSLPTSLHSLDVFQVEPARPNGPILPLPRPLA